MPVHSLDVLDADSLLSHAIQGNPEALTALLERYGPACRRRIRDLLGDRYRSVFDEDDVMQETYVEAFLAIRRFDPRGTFDGWLGRIAKNNLLDAIRGMQAARRREHSRHTVLPQDDDHSLELESLLVDSGTPPSGRAARNELRAEVLQAVANLPTTYREVIELYDLQNLSPPEVAQRLQCSVGAVFMRRARAHQFLRELLHESPLVADLPPPPAECVT